MLCLLTAAICVASFWLCVVWVPIDHFLLGMGNGNITLVLNSAVIGKSPHFSTWTPRSLDAAEIPRALWPELAFAIGAYRIPMWIPFLLIAVSTISIWRLDRPRRLGWCRHCGYDITGNVSGRCPECGSACMMDKRRAKRE